jgi:hypothetical protein
MENDEEPSVFAARTAYEYYRQDGVDAGVYPVTMPIWDSLPEKEQRFWQTLWAKSHEAYWNQRQFLENGALRGGLRE